MIKNETDLYLPVKKYFESLGYRVDAEVKDCDVVASKDDEIIICELKKSFSLALLYQIIERKAITSNVYAVIPRPKNMNSRVFRNQCNLLRSLGVGLLIVLKSNKRVDLVLEPAKDSIRKHKKRTERIKKEVNGRNMNINTGGSTRKKIVTAHKESVISALCYIEKNKQIRLRDCNEYVKAAIKSNHYKYFVRIDRGIYTMNSDANNMLNDKDYKDIVEFYRKDIDLCLK